MRVTPAIKPTQHSALLADRHCGKGTRLIYYMNPGELLSRSFTPKDTHSVKGDLLIVYAEVDRVGAYSVDRTLATTSVLGFSSPSFSFGMDIILPAEINQQLRDVLLSDPNAGTSRGKPDSNPEVRAVRAMDEFKGTFIPEVSESASGVFVLFRFLPFSSFVSLSSTTPARKICGALSWRRRWEDDREFINEAFVLSNCTILRDKYANIAKLSILCVIAALDLIRQYERNKPLVDFLTTKKMFNFNESVCFISFFLHCVFFNTDLGCSSVLSQSARGLVHQSAAMGHAPHV